MEGLKPELTSFLRESMIRKASNLNSSEDGLGFSGSAGLSGLAGLASIAGGFDQILLAAGGGGIALSETEDTSSFATDSATTVASAESWITSTRDMMHCGHFAPMPGGKLHFTMEETESCRFWTEGVVSSGVAGFGLVGNLLSIWVLSMPEMRSTAFNRLLLALAIIDSLFICPGIIISTSKGFSWKTEWYNRLFPVFLYPFSEMALCSSIYMTVAIAVERYIGLCRPLQRLSWRPCSAKAYVLTVLIIAVILNIPKFLEAETIYKKDPFSNTTWTRIGVTDLRMNPNYITYYWMWTRLLATGVIPLVLLALLNSKIFLAIRRSKQQLRSLAIRSALPMAILAGHPAGTGSNGSTSPVPDLRIDSPASPLQNGRHFSNGFRDKKLVKNGSLNAVGVSPEDPDPLKENGARIVTFAVTPETPEIRLISARPKRTLIQRSVSAFVPSTSNRNSALELGLSNGSGNSAHPTKFTSRLLRSQSAATTTAVNATQSTLVATASSDLPPSHLNSDLNLAPILFGVVIVFVGCNFLRVVLNIYDFAVVDSIIDCESRGVGRLPPPWIMCSISVSHLFLMVNSSVNFLVYCVAGTRFRGVLERKCREKISSIGKFFQELAKRLCLTKSAADNEPAQNGGYPFPVTAPGMLTRNSTRQLVSGRDDFVRPGRCSRNGLNFRKEGIPENQRTLLPEPNHRNITRL